MALEYLRNQIEIHKMYFQYWITMANTGCISQDIWKGDKKLSKEELIKNAIDTAENHIKIVSEMNDTLLKELNKII